MTLQHLDANAIGDFNRNELISDPFDSTENPTGREHRFTALQIAKHFLLLLLTFALRTNNQKIKNEKDKPKWDNNLF